MARKAESGRDRVADSDVPPHFVIEIGGVSLAYCYIRKNACSAWKRLFIQESPVRYDPAAWKNELAFMLDRHGARTIAAIDRCDRRVVVVRDPVDRYVSAFVNLLVTRSPPGTPRLRKLGEKFLGSDILDLDFDRFLASQLPGRAGARGLDRHLWPQVWHLAPTRYTDVIDIDRLATDMKRLIGDELGARYFDRPVNATSAAGSYEDADAPSLPVRELVARYRAIGGLPARETLIAGGRAETIRAAYAEDSSLYDACRAHDREHPDASMTFEAAEAARSGPKRKKGKRPAGP